MNCPKCGKEMESGFLYSGGSPLVWTEREKKKTILSRGSDLVIREGGIFAPLPKACLCRDCRAILLEY